MDNGAGRDVMVLLRALRLALLLGVACTAGNAAAADRFFAYNLTTTTDFAGVYLAPAGTEHWGPNQALNDKDKSLDRSERLSLTGIARGKFDVKLVDSKGHICVKRDVDLTRDLIFEIRDADVASCRRGGPSQ
ncbi:hypothetical protein [Limobrevibacterium gyesilva]|uniref:Uncharacterized protein n=1 Tax=Limobrevibacterium gyesilva TaxID=2991712 RepID=A0AA41YHA9_9PROT|nr:hypothetical protein [Limobrevibacterium gyesilva]MCW3473249.1 hypothetical protein [Limobrevibacterium gyesilva]